MKWSRGAAALVLAAATLSACGDGSSSGADGDRLSVIASFYPLQEAVEKVGGEHVTVDPLTPPGAEPHDLELTPRDILEVAQADAVVYLSGFQPAVDDAIGEADDPLDVAQSARLDLSATDDGHDHSGDDHADDDHADEGHADGDHADEGSASSGAGRDPHFWLDPERYASVVDAVANYLTARDPDNGAAYQANASAFRGELETLDGEFEAGLKSCTSTTLVTAHAAFGYLAEAYGFTQEGITGVDADGDPNTRAVAEAIDFVKQHQVTTVYAETLAPSAVAETIARDGGATLAVLDPIEGITDASAAEDYLGIMRANLATLRTGQECS